MRACDRSEQAATWRARCTVVDDQHERIICALAGSQAVFLKYGRRCACPCKRTVQAPAHAAGLAVAVLLNLALLGEFVLDEKCHDSVALIALELEHLPHLLVLNDAAVAAVDLLDCLEDLLEV